MDRWKKGKEKKDRWKKGKEKKEKNEGRVKKNEYGWRTTQKEIK